MIPSVSMKWLRSLVSSPNFWPILVVVAFAVLAGRSLIFESGYFNMHDDLQMMRQLEMEKCFKDGQIPCRWIQDMGYGFGFPLFNFYPPLPYLIGQGIRLIGYSFVTVVKLTFALSFVISGIAMYLLAKDFFGRLGGVVSAIFYIWAPYHALDVYVRGAMNEAWALAWFPLIFWAAYKLIASKKKATGWTIGLALSWFALLTSHNLMVLIFSPLFAVWVLIHLWHKGSWHKIPQLVVSGILALGLAAFFTLPAFMEQGLVQVETLVQGYYEYIAHFADLNQLFISRFWGFGASVWLQNDKMSFQIGHIHWILSLVVGGWLIRKLLKEKSSVFKKLKKNPILLVALFMLLVGWFAAFMAHYRSTPIWLAITPLKFVQFPWRFVAITTFAFSFTAGAVVVILKDKRIGRWIIGLLIIGLVVFNWNYFLPENGKMGPLTDEEKFSGAAWELQQTAGIFDYLPKAAKEAPKMPQKYLAEVMQGTGEIKDTRQGTNWAEFGANIESDSAVIRLGIFQFPNWRVFVDGTEVNTFVAEDEKWGRMYVEIPKGEHFVRAQLFNTPVRSAGNLISLVTWIGLFTFPFWRKRLGS